MGQLLYFAKKYYFYVNLTAASTVALSSAGFTAGAIESSLDPGIAYNQSDAKKADRKRPRSKGQRERLDQYDGILAGNLLRDSAEEKMEEGGESFNPTDLTLLGTVAGPWHLAMATFRVKGESDTKEYASGSKIGDYRIAWIGREKVVVKNAAGDRFTIEVGDEPDPKAGNRNNKRKSKAKSKAQVGGTITKVVSRDEVDKLVKDPKSLYKGLRMGPSMKNGQISGYKIKRLKRDHFFYKLGARSGDTITRVNGQDMNDHEKMLGLLGELKTANKLSIDVDRRGTPTSFNIVIK